MVTHHIADVFPEIGRVIMMKNGRIFADGSVVGTIRMHGQGQTRFAALPAGTIRVDGGSMWTSRGANPNNNL